MRICAEVADGLQALADAGMVHRDVKPANILLDHAGTAYITDFGLAKVSDASVLTRPGQPLGSMDYMPPEQIRGEPVTGAADIYALGCVAYRVPDRAAAVRRPGGHGVLWAHLQDDPPDAAAERPTSPALAQVLAGALRKQPAERPATSVEFAALARRRDRPTSTRADARLSARPDAAGVGGG